jgi:hypothetical protein
MCVGAVIACWNHYNDKPLDSLQRNVLQEHLRYVLPEISCAEWEAANIEYQRYVDSQNEM